MLTPLIEPETLRNTVSPEVYMAVFDDMNTGDPGLVDQSAAVQEVIDDASVMVVSRLPAIYGQVPDGVDTSIPILLKTAIRMYLRYFTFIRRPEYTRVTGREETGMLEAADSIMAKIQSGIMQIPPRDNPPQASPGNIGGIVYESGPRLMTESLDGTSNSGDF